MDPADCPLAQLLQRAQSYAAALQYDEAVECYEEYLRHAPEDLDARKAADAQRLEREAHARMAGVYDLAYRCNLYLAIDDPLLNEAMGLLYQALGRGALKLAEEYAIQVQSCLEAVLRKQDPAAEEGWLTAAHLASLQGKHPFSIELLERSRHYQEHIELYEALALAEELLELAERCGKNIGQPPADRLRLAMRLRELQAIQEAMDELEFWLLEENSDDDDEGRSGAGVPLSPRLPPLGGRAENEFGT